MLVLSRKLNETIEIADGLISIMVLELRGDKVRIGINAPRDVAVHRGEVAAAIAHSRLRGYTKLDLPLIDPVPLTFSPLPAESGAECHDVAATA